MPVVTQEPVNHDIAVFELPQGGRFATLGAGRTFRPVERSPLVDSEHLAGVSAGVRRGVVAVDQRQVGRTETVHGDVEVPIGISRSWVKPSTNSSMTRSAETVRAAP